MAQSSLSAQLPAAPRVLVERPQYIPRQGRTSLANLWQVPLLLVSLGVFALAAWLLIDPQPAAGFQRQLALVQHNLEAKRYDAALGMLNDVLITRPEPAEEVRTRLLIAETIDRRMQRNGRLQTPQAHRRVVEEIQKAYELGFVATPDTSDRLARSLEALGQIDEAAANYQRAVELLERGQRAGQAVPMRKSAIEMLIAYDRDVSAAEALKDFLNVTGLADDERAWALGELARIHTDAGRYVEARSLLAAALALSPDDAIRGQVSYRLGYSAWKLGDRQQAVLQLESARRQLGPGHPMDAEACYLLGVLAQEREKTSEASAHFDAVVRDYPETPTALRALLARGNARILAGDFDQGAADLATVADELWRRPSARPIRADLLDALQRGGRVLASRDRYDLAILLVQREQEVDPQSTADCLARRCRYWGKRIEQLDLQVASEDQLRPGSAALRLRDAKRESADAHLEYARLLAPSEPMRSTELFRQTIKLYESAGDNAAMLAALEAFAADFPQHPAASEALVRLAIVHAADSRGRAVVPRLRQAWQHWMKLAGDDQPTPRTAVFNPGAKDGAKQ